MWLPSMHVREEVPGPNQVGPRWPGTACQNPLSALPFHISSGQERGGGRVGPPGARGLPLLSPGRAAGGRAGSAGVLGRALPAQNVGLGGRGVAPRGQTSLPTRRRATHCCLGLSGRGCLWKMLLPEDVQDVLPRLLALVLHREDAADASKESVKPKKQNSGGQPRAGEP